MPPIPETLTPRQRAYQAFFRELLDKVKEEHPNLTRAKKAYPQNWFTFPVGRSGFAISACFAQGRKFRVELYIDVGDKARNKAAFDALRDDREVIEASVGQPIVWERLDERQASRIYCGTHGSIDDGPARLEELQEWALDLVWRYREVFSPRVRNLAL